MVSRVALATRAETAVFTVLLSASNACLRIGATPALESLFFPQQFLDRFAITQTEINDIFF